MAVWEVSNIWYVVWGSEEFEKILKLASDREVMN